MAKKGGTASGTRSSAKRKRSAMPGSSEEDDVQASKGNGKKAAKADKAAEKAAEKKRRGKDTSESSSEGSGAEDGKDGDSGEGDGDGDGDGDESSKTDGEETEEEVIIKRKPRTKKGSGKRAQGDEEEPIVVRMRRLEWAPCSGTDMTYLVDLRALWRGHTGPQEDFYEERHDTGPVLDLFEDRDRPLQDKQQGEGGEHEGTRVLVPMLQVSTIHACLRPKHRLETHQMGAGMTQRSSS